MMLPVRSYAVQKRLYLYLLFVAYGLIRFWGSPGDDLSSSYVGCRLLSSGAGDHLYDFHPELFHVVDTPAWLGIAQSAHFKGFLHPYVQTPLWAWILNPLCTPLEFGPFSDIFLCAALLSLVAIVEIVARAWAGSFLRPVPLAILLVAITLSTPFQYSMWIVQTHPLFLMLTVLALYLAERDRPIAAGAALAAACAVKITPGVLLVYWLVGARRRAALWFVLLSVAIAAATVAVVGLPLTLDYVQSMRRVSNVLLVSFNNQSLAAWLAYSGSMGSELINWRILPLAPALKAVCLLASVASIAFAGWMSRRKESSGSAVALALIGMTVFSPIAWTHYFLALIPAVMVLTNTRGVLAVLVAATALVLNCIPVALDPISASMEPMTIVRSHFFSAVFLMAALVLRYAEQQWFASGDAHEKKQGSLPAAAEHPVARDA